MRMPKVVSSGLASIAGPGLLMSGRGRVTTWGRWSARSGSSSGTAPPTASSPENDQKLKGKLSKALGKEGVLTAAGVQGLMDPSTFAKLAGADGRLDAAEVGRSWTPTCPSPASGSTPRSSPTPTS